MMDRGKERVREFFVCRVRRQGSEGDSPRNLKPEIKDKTLHREDVYQEKMIREEVSVHGKKSNKENI